MLTIPNINEITIDFIKNKLNELNSPIHVVVTPELLAEKNKCFNNVKEKIKKDAGRKCYGWIIWEWPSAYLKAEYHVLWINDKNSLIDITPHGNNVNSIVFVADSNNLYIPDITIVPAPVVKPICNDQKVIEYCDLENEIAKEQDLFLEMKKNNNISIDIEQCIKEKIKLLGIRKLNLKKYILRVYR